MNLLVASSNPHKITEITAVWAELSSPNTILSYELFGLEAIGKSIPEPIEDQPTFVANAVLKASYYAQRTGYWCLADDSGLQVDAIGGEPGVKSARFSGMTGSRQVVDPANNRLLIQRLGDTPAEHRTARFVCAMAVAIPPISSAVGQSSRTIAQVTGEIEGRILTADEAGPGSRGRGRNGFGYDPLFFLPKFGKTTAQITPSEKNCISHRGQAARRLFHEMQKILTDDSLFDVQDQSSP